MGMYLTVKGVTSPPETWRLLKCIYDACREASIDPPGEVMDFFGGVEPDDDGVVISLAHHVAVTETDGGFDVLLEDLPDAIKIIRCVLE